MRRRPENGRTRWKGRMAKMAEFVKVAVDAMGGDNAPAEIVKGALQAVEADGRIQVFLVGRQEVIEKELVTMLGRWNRIPITYAGGIRSLEDIRSIKELGKNRIHITVGSALDLYGGSLSFEKVRDYAGQEL